MEPLQDNKTTSYTIDLPLFEGPLDLLLFLIKTQEINIYDIPIAQITHQFLQYISILKHFNMEISSEFLAMASELIFIKTRLLIPLKKNEMEEESFIQEDPRKELVEKLLEYKKYKEAIDQLDNSNQNRDILLFMEKQDILFDIDQDENSWKPMSVLELVKNFERIINRSTFESKTYIVKSHQHSVEGKIVLIRKKLAESRHVLFNQLIEEKEFDKIEFICLFLAILELVKINEIIILQHALFADIKIEKK